MRLACFQTNVVFADPMANARRAASMLEQVAEQGVEMAVFPEAFLTGYCVSSRSEAEQIAIPVSRSEGEIRVPDPSLEFLKQVADRLGIHVVVGFAGKESGELFNGAALIYPGGKIGLYEKTHLPELGFDHFASPGKSLPVFETVFGRIGILICYDLRPPEACRVLALRGADLVVLPTNWPTRKGTTPALMCPSRAMENKIFFASCNRIGDENGFSFRGESAIYGLGGEILDSAGTEEAVLIADLDLAAARDKRSVVIPGQFATEAFGCRQPDLYRDLTD